MKFPFTRFEIVGHSMEPTLCAGERVWVVRSRRIRSDTIVAFRHSGKVFVKRITEVGVDGSILVTGDNVTDSYDSRRFGRIAQGAVIGKVAFRV